MCRVMIMGDQTVIEYNYEYKCLKCQREVRSPRNRNRCPYCGGRVQRYSSNTPRLQRLKSRSVRPR